MEFLDGSKQASIRRDTRVTRKRAIKREGWKVNEWNLPGTKEWCSWLTFIFRLSTMPIHPSILAGNAGVQNTEPCRATFPPPYPTPFSVSLFLNTGCIFPGHSRCQESRSSNVKGAADICWKKAQRGRANCPSAPFIREGVKSARRHNGILRAEEELEKRATDCIFPLFVSVGCGLILSRDCRSGMKRYRGRTMSTSLHHWGKEGRVGEHELSTKSVDTGRKRGCLKGILGRGR